MHKNTYTRPVFHPEAGKAKMNTCKEESVAASISIGSMVRHGHRDSRMHTKLPRAASSMAGTIRINM